MGPRFKPFVVLVGDCIELAHVVGTETAMEGHVLRSCDNGNRVKLQNAHTPHDASKVASIDPASWPRISETLRTEGDATGDIETHIPFATADHGLTVAAATSGDLNGKILRCPNASDRSAFSS